MAILNNNPLIGASGQSTGAYKIERSLRFNSADSAYLSRTPASAGNRKTWTVSFWLKKSIVETRTGVCGNPDASGLNGTYIEFNTSDLNIGDYGTSSWNWFLVTYDVFRDPAAWYNFVIAVDTTQSTASNRVKVYVNNSQITVFDSATYPSLNADTFWNNNQAAAIGRLGQYNGLYLHGYLTDFHNIDGQQLTPSSFGEVDADTGVWKPKRYSGSYGTNGFKLTFSDNSNTTAATLGKDTSGNGNNWTPNNFSVTAGAGNDSLVDTPSNNFATLNPLQISTTYATLSNGNIQYVDTTAGGSYRASYSTMFASGGKFYFEATVSSVSGTPYPTIGLVSPPPQNDIYTEQTLSGYQGYGYYADGTKATNDTYTAFGSTYTAGDTVAVAVDIDAGKVWFAKNGTWQASGDPAAGTNPAFNIVTGRPYGFSVGNGSSASSIQMDCNFGQRAWLYTPPTGFVGLCSNNLPTPAVGATASTRASKYFNTILWTGNNSNPRSITGVGFQPDFSWLARRDVGYGTWLYDAVRGATKAMQSNTTAAEFTYQQLNSFDADGFTQAGSPDQGNNVSGGQYIAWNWKANGAGSSNTAGSITSTVSANTTAGFSIVTYTGTGSNATVGHGLGVAPSMIIVKRRDTTAGWPVYHAGIGADRALYLQSAQARDIAPDYWNNTAPTSTVFTVGTLAGLNGSSGTFVAYCCAQVSGYSSFGIYTGNGVADGPFVYTGFRPAFVLVKKANVAGGNWWITDNKRDTYNATTKILASSLSDAESAGTWLDFTSNGFKIRTASTDFNESSQIHVYAAFAEHPFKYSLAR